MDGYAVRAADIASAPARSQSGCAQGDRDGRRGNDADASRRTRHRDSHHDRRADCRRRRCDRSGRAHARHRFESRNPRAGRAAIFIRPRGEDLRAGELLMSAGKVLTASDLGMLASLNRSMIDVYRKPQVAIVATGDELVDVDQIPTGAQIVNSSAYALAAAISRGGRRSHDPENRARHYRGHARAAFRGDALRCCVLHRRRFGRPVRSCQRRDGRAGDARAVSWRRAAARAVRSSSASWRERPVFGLPGNPVSTMVCFYLYARPALRKMGGFQKLGLPRVRSFAAPISRLPRTSPNSCGCAWSERTANSMRRRPAIRARESSVRCRAPMRF